MWYIGRIWEVYLSSRSEGRWFIAQVPSGFVWFAEMDQCFRWEDSISAANLVDSIPWETSWIILQCLVRVYSVWWKFKDYISYWFVVVMREFKHDIGAGLCKDWSNDIALKMIELMNSRIALSESERRGSEGTIWSLQIGDENYQGKDCWIA